MPPRAGELGNRVSAGKFKFNILGWAGHIHLNKLAVIGAAFTLQLAAEARHAVAVRIGKNNLVSFRAKVLPRVEAPARISE